MVLAPSEATNLRFSGTELSEVRLSEEERRRLGRVTYYRFENDCGNLQRDEDGYPTGCIVYGQESPLRPHACSDLVAGSSGCAKDQIDRVDRSEDEFVVLED